MLYGVLYGVLYTGGIYPGGIYPGGIYTSFTPFGKKPGVNRGFTGVYGRNNKE